MVTTPFWKTPFAIVALAVIALGGVVVAVNVVRSAGGDDTVALPGDLTVASLTKSFGEGNRGPGAFREVLERDDLTDEQRREAMRNFREVGRRQMDARINEYFEAASEEEKTSILDAQIDEFQNLREQWQRRRAEREGDEDRERMRDLFQPPSQQERKAQSENRNPDETARRMAYFSAMRSRMNARGITTGRGGSGGRGGLGRGFRP